MLNGRLRAWGKGYRRQLYEDVIFCFNSQFFGLETSHRAIGSEKDGGV